MDVRVGMMNVCFYKMVTYQFTFIIIIEGMSSRLKTQFFKHLTMDTIKKWGRWRFRLMESIGRSTTASSNLSNYLQSSNWKSPPTCSLINSIKKHEASSSWVEPSFIIPIRSLNLWQTKYAYRLSTIRREMMIA